jgi:hypothetical protein
MVKQFVIQNAENKRYLVGRFLGWSNNFSKAKMFDNKQEAGYWIESNEDYLSGLLIMIVEIWYSNN